MASNLRVFSGRSVDGVSTVMPEVSSWLSESLQEISDVRDHSDHLMVFWCNMITAGIVSATKSDFVVSFLANKLTEFKRNGVGVVIHSNRAAQLSFDKSLALSSKVLSYY